MSILINDMEMPTENDELRLIIHSNGQVIISHKTYYEEAEAIPVQPHGDLIDRNETIKALWKALYEYEDKTEKQFVESPELDVADWILHQIFVQNMSDIDRQTILQMPTVIPADESNMDTEEIVRCKDCEHWETSWTPCGVSDGRHYCAPLDLYPSADWFCADGKKRTETKQLSNVPVVIEAEEEA